jgi:uncharacterized protein YcfJ
MLLLASCATHTGWTPSVDYRVDRNQHSLERDLAECRQLAQSQSSTGAEVAKGAGIGALLGATGGAVVGAIFGNPGAGAATGAATGALGGGVYSGTDADSTYKRYYIDCMRGRGHPAN